MSLTREIDIAGEAVAGFNSAVDHLLSIEVSAQLLIEKETRKELFKTARALILFVNQLYEKHEAIEASERLRRQLQASLALDGAA